ncbi:MAG: SAM-dependent methyltransferase [Acidimicrobiia bacterium]
MSLLSSLRSRIRADGPMPFEKFMAACLYDADHGFFATGPLRSVKAGDFLTSPEVSPAFGRTIARFVEQERQRIGSEGFTIVELGAGSGSLLRALLAVLGRRPERVVAVETSPAARDALRTLDGVAVLEGIDGLPDRMRGVVVANELLDNLPVRLAVRTGDGWEERYIGLEGSGLGWVAAAARPDTVAWADAFCGAVDEGGLVEVQLAAGEYVSAVVRRLDVGSFVAFDYGGTAEELEPRRTRGTLRTYRAHHLGPDPLLEPGATDVTVDVNFTAMVAAARAAGAEVELHRQDDFLVSLGLRDEISALRGRELELAKDRSATLERLQVRSERTDAETLLHPRGLGDFRVMVARVAGPGT